MKKQNKQNGITLIALVITIIILLILAGITISQLTGSGLFARANDAKIASKIGEIEEFATLKVYELYTENIKNMDAVNDATIRTALKAELQAKGYEVKDVNTTSDTVNGLKIQDSTGENNFDSLSLLQQKNTTIKVSLDTASQLISSKTYIKIYDDWYELIINDKTIKVSREKYEEPADNGNTYEIKLTPPTSGIIMTAGETQITSETTITPGALITVQAGNDIGTFSFTVKETTSSVTKNVDINVTADPAYATDLSIAVYGGEKEEVTPGETLQLVATKTPTTSTDTVSWSIKSGSATIDATGLVTANSDATVGSTITVSATCNREDGTTSTVGEKTLDITVKYKSYAVGDQVTVGGESFYVIKASGTNEEKVTLLAAKNIATTAMLQSDSAGTVAFSSTNYWSSISGITYPYDLNNTATSADTDAIAKARAYGTAKGGTGRLMTVGEVVALGGDMDNYDSSACPSWINSSNYWLGSASSASSVWYVYGEYSSLGFNDYDYGNDFDYGVRPVIVISKSLIL